MKIQESAEMYLETILVLSEHNETVRSIDIVNHLSYSKPSVSRAVNSLKEERFITISDQGHIQLTAAGFQLAKKVYEKHQLLHDVFIFLGVSEQNAREDACKIEHVISDETFGKIKDFYKKTTNK